MADGDSESRSRYHGFGTPAPRTDPAGWLDGAPTSGVDQSCALCGSGAVTWVHPLAGNLVEFRVFGKGHTLPSFWTLCDRCERLYAAGDDESAVEVMKASDGWPWSTEEDVDELIRRPLAVFRRADKGARRLAK
jgi:hypothetical protein